MKDALAELAAEEVEAQSENRWPDEPDLAWEEKLLLKTHEDIVRKAWEERACVPAVS